MLVEFELKLIIDQYLIFIGFLVSFCMFSFGDIQSNQQVVELFLHMYLINFFLSYLFLHFCHMNNKISFHIYNINYNINVNVTESYDIKYIRNENNN